MSDLIFASDRTVENNVHAPKCPLPAPNSWYVLCFSEELKPEQIINRTLAGNALVLYRTESGQAMAINAHCPHLGAHFNAGGKVIGENIQCPYHEFRFDTQGDCVHTPYEGCKPPPGAKNRVWQLREHNGMVFVWYHCEGAEPDWEVPNLQDDEYPRVKFKSFVVRSHPQEFNENAVDSGHLYAIHMYDNTKTLEPVTLEGPLLSARYGLQRRKGLFGAESPYAEFKTHLWGQGFNYQLSTVPQYNLFARTHVLATPTEDGFMMIHLAVSLKPLDNPEKIHPLLRLLPKAWVHKLVWAGYMKEMEADLKQDFPMWQNKTYLDKPALAKGDGPVALYRKWSKQFYHHTATENKKAA
ncbi:MAG: Rieske (2Fe-2S) protein [Pseudomonadales bacterium]|nr:Rieske (2Fe-2S) protein [Pseudomonadales bacterium]